MDLKNLLGKLDQLNEAEMTSRKVAGKAYGGAAQADDEDDEDGEKKPAAPAVKRGRGRPRKVGGEAETSAKYGGAAELQRWIVGNVPKKSKELEKLPKAKHKLSDTEPTAKKKVKESLKDWITELDQLMEAEQLTIEPAKASTQVIKQGTKVLGQVSNPQLAATLKQAIGKGEMSLAGAELDETDYSAKAARAGKDIGKPGKMFSKIAKTAGEKYGSKERGEKVAGAVLAKLRSKTNEADIYTDGMNSMGAGLGAGRSDSTLESKQSVAEGSRIGTLARKVVPGLGRIQAASRSRAERDQAYHAGDEVRKDGDTRRPTEPGDDYWDTNTMANRHHRRADKYQKIARGNKDVAEGKKPSYVVVDIDGHSYAHSSLYDAEIEGYEAGAKLYKNGKHVGNFIKTKKHGTQLVRPDGSAWTKNWPYTGDDPNMRYDFDSKKQGVAEAKNHMDETEYNTYAGWKAACRKAGADKFDGDRDICQAMKDGKGIGEWDGEKGSVYDDSHKKKKMAEGKKPDFLDLDKDGNKKESMKKAAHDAKKDKKKVDEGMDQRMKAAHHRGKAHALAKEGYNCRYDEGSEEARMYHEGYKMGLDECYGIMPMRGVVVGEDDMDEGMMGAALGGIAGAASGRTPSAAMIGAELGSAAQDMFTGEDMDRDVVDDMASFGARHGEDMEEGILGTLGGAALGGLVGGPVGAAVGAVGGQEATRGGSALFDDEFEEGNAFTAALAKTPKGGKFSVGGKTFTDKSDYNAKVDEMMMAFEGWDKQLNELLTEGEQVEEGMSISVSKGQQGLPDSVSVTASDAEADKLMALVKQLGVFGAEESHGEYGAPTDTAVHQHGDLEVVDDHDGMMALMKKMSGQDSGEDYADEMDSEMSHDHGDSCEGCGMPSDECQCDHQETCEACGDMMEAGHSCENKEIVDEVESEDQQEFEVAEDNAPDSEEAETTADENAEAEEDAAIAKYRDADKDITVNEEQLDEWANDAGKDGTDTAFMRDIEFMTKTIAGGLNKEKSTGQTTIPVIAGQSSRMGVDGMNEGSLADLKKLSGIK